MVDHVARRVVGDRHHSDEGQWLGGRQARRLQEILNFIKDLIRIRGGKMVVPLE
jgi:hypothetical protein